MNNTGQLEQFAALQTRFGSFRVFKVVGVFDVETHGRLPFGRFALKIIDIADGEFQATPNVQVWNSATKCIEHVCGIGRSIDEAMISAINMLMSEAEKQRMNKLGTGLDESDFVWLNWQPYVQLTMPPTF